MRIRTLLLSILILACLACWQRQDHDILAPEIPHYTLSGYTVDIDDTLRVIPHTPISLTAVTLLYDTTFDPVTLQSDNDGYYEIEFIIPGDYILTAEREGYAVNIERLSIEHNDRILDIALPKPFVNATSYRWLGAYRPHFTFAPEGLWIMSITIDFQPPQVYIPVLYQYSISASEISEVRWIRVPYLLIQAVTYSNGLLYFYSNNHVSNLRTIDQDTHIPEPTLIDSFRIDAPLSGLAWDGSGFWTTFGSAIQYRGSDLRTITESWIVDSGKLSALTIEDPFLWAYDGDRDLLLQLDKTGNVLSTQRLINGDTGEWIISHDLAFSPFRNLWVSQENSKYLWIFNTDQFTSPQ